MRRAPTLARALIATLLSVLLGSLAVVPAQAAEAVVETSLMIEGTPEPDGRPVKLDVTILTTDPTTPRPGIVLAHGFNGTKNDSLEVARTLAADGYAVIIYTARGFGASGGSIHLDHPDFEGADAVKIIDLAASRPEVARAGDDPVIGVAGASYGGAVSLIAAGLDPRVDAIVPAFTFNNLNQALFPQYAVAGEPGSLADVTPAGGPGVFKRSWASLLFGGGDRAEAPANDPVCGRFTPALCQGYLAVAESGRPDPRLTAFLEESGPQSLLAKITAPTLIIAGEDDTLFPLDQADANLRGLPADTPARLTWVAGGHDGALSVDAILADLTEWFDRYLKQDGTPADSSFSVLVPETSLVGQGGTPDPETRVAPAYPGRGADRTEQTLALIGEPQPVLAPPGGSPAALTNLPGTGGGLSQASSVVGYSLGVLPGQAALFTTEPLESSLSLVGSGRINLEVTSSTPNATLFASLWDLGPDVNRTVGGRTVTGPSSAVLPQLAVAPIQLAGLSPERPTRVTVALPPVAHQVPVDHRLQVVISSTDQAYALPTTAAVYQIGLSGDRALALPQVALTAPNAGQFEVPLPLIIVVSLLVIAAVVAVVVFQRRQRAAHPNLDLVGVPLVVNNVVKTYKDGFRAVDGISFRAEPGQVVGLLGPNGAGKTTAIRMLVGLIRPDSGEIYVNGEPVHGGADVLGSVGAFIEGPGFLPHLTGRQNLTAYWQATGRPVEEAHLEEALQIAGLGSALERKVRGYSQGMRQRLGIAQAMLGLPSLLVLDEPTNGLDPPQIKAMRAVLADYAAAGRTVVISSHLLSEVEHTCSHVVVMDKGKVILTGVMAELTASDRVTMIGFAQDDQIERAGDFLRAQGLAAVRAGDVLRVTSELPRAELVARLVAAGFPVTSVDGRRQLEEVFMSLVGAPADGPEDADV